MYKILMITDTEKHREHADIARRLKKAVDGDVTVFDMNCCMAQHEKYFAIKDMASDVIITLDAAGFEMVNITGVLSYNSLACRMAHILFDKVSRYGEAMGHLQNLSMFTYIPGSESLEDFYESYPLVPNVYRHELGSGSFDTARGAQWFEHFCREARL